jgi:membrane protein
VEQLLLRFDQLYLSVDRHLGGRLTVLIRTALAFDKDDGAVMSRSIAYYALFSLFPLLLIVLAFASSVLASDAAQGIVLETVGNLVPGATDLVAENIEQLAQAGGTVGLLALVGLLWSASGVFSALYRAVNRAWGNPKSELFWTEKLYGLAVVLLFGLLLVATTFYSAFVSVVRSWQIGILGWQPFADPSSGRLLGWLSALVPALISVIAFTVIYRTTPRNEVRWRDVWIGGLLAGLVWEGARQLFAWYLANFARHSLIYGSVAVIIGILLWAYLSAMILLAGAEFTAQHTQWRRAGRPIESRPPRQWMTEWSKWKIQ